MVYLILCVLFSSAIFVTFKLFDRYHINTLQAIVINYFVAFAVGVFSFKGNIQFSTIPSKPWFVGALILAALFISVFNVMAITSQKNGVSVAAVAGKMAVVIPIIAGAILYQERLTFLKITGILLALLAVYFTTHKNSTNTSKKASLLYPLLLFIGAGIIDTTLKYVQTNYVAESEMALFSGILFGIAGVFGLVYYLTKRTVVHYRNLIAGIILGIINYYSIYYLLKELEDLETKGMVSAEIFSINNVAIVTLSSILAVIIFKEKLNSKNKIGVLIAVISIFLMSIELFLDKH